MEKKDYFERKESQNSDSKLSWREKDALKNAKSVYVERPKKSDSSLQRQNTKLAKKELEKLFIPKAKPKAEAAWKLLVSKKGAQKAASAVAYLSEFGVPPETEKVMTILDIEHEASVELCLNAILNRSHDMTESESDMILGKLKILKMTLEGSSVEAAIINTIARLTK